MIQALMQTPSPHLLR